MGLTFSQIFQLPATSSLGSGEAFARTKRRESPLLERTWVREHGSCGCKSRRVGVILLGAIASARGRLKESLPWPGDHAAERLADTKPPALFIPVILRERRKKNGRGGRIRTADPLTPSQVRYPGCATPRTALRIGVSDRRARGT